MLRFSTVYQVSGVPARFAPSQAFGSSFRQHDFRTARPGRADLDWLRSPSDNLLMEFPGPSDQPTKVNDQASAIAFVQWCVRGLGLGYHPDTQFADYRDSTGVPCFTAGEAKDLDRLQEATFLYCDPYEIGFEEFRRLQPDLGTDLV